MHAEFTRMPMVNRWKSTAEVRLALVCCKGEILLTLINHIGMFELMQMLQVLLVSGGRGAEMNHLSSTEVRLKIMQ